MFQRRIRWPRQFGFEIAGHGPSFVTAVEKDSIGYNSGLQAGDQILELDDQDVTNMSAKAIKTLAKHSRTQPPTLGVVSRKIQTNLIGSKLLGLGFTVNDTKPVTVETVEEGGPAEEMGIRKGDIILEVNGTMVKSSSTIKPYLSTSGRNVAVGYIPIGKNVGRQARHKPIHSSEGSRVKRARTLHDRMNDILGEDYEKKLASVSVLKQYAEDRDVGTLATALCFILKTPKQRKLLDHIRSFIPLKQQPKFDNLINRTQNFQSRPETTVSSPTAHKLGERRTFQVVRENGKFGFVIKGSNPAFVETIDTNGPANKAGIQIGDFIVKLNGMDVRKCSHSHLIHLLQDSGTAPIIEILRSDQDGYPYSSSSLGSLSTLTSNSSHSDSGWIGNDSNAITDKDGRSYNERAEYLLTRKEKARIKLALTDYDSSCNIVELFECVSEILDTPSKKTLWMFIIARLPSHHQQYCINQINLPTSVLLEAVDSSPEGTDKSQQLNEADNQRNVTCIDVQSTNGISGVQVSAFHRQVDYLLTSRERTVLKKALQLYTENRNVSNLYEDLEAIFDTPSKRTIWMYIIPLLSVQHKDEIRERIQNPNAVFMPVSQRKLKEPLPITSSEDDEHELFSRSGARKLITKPTHGAANFKGLDVAILKELEETRKLVQEAKTLFTREGRSLDSTRYVTVIPIDKRSQNGSIEGPPHIQLSNGPLHCIGIDDNDRNNLSPQSFNGSPAMQNGQQDSSLQVPNGDRLRIPTFTIGPDIDTVDESKKHFKESKFSKMGGGTFNRHALTALKQLDEAVAAEVNGIENYNGPSPTGKSDAVSEVPSSVPPAPPPPPPVAPPPPPPPPSNSEQNRGKMNVKRINWEKIDQNRVENTIWEQLGDKSDLQDVVRYLELEQQFSTKSPSHRLAERKNEIFILNPKKAYNISILLGHLKLNDSEVKHALYQMDEDILTPELVRQLLAYAPNKDEIEYFNAYNGDLEELSKPDRFTYEMSRVPGYEQRLKALVFKENFKEKIDEMKEQLQHIRKASIELQHSKKLSRLLELILAMGNYMNEGNNRVGQAKGFKIKFLSQLEITKTSDNKLTFLHVLADTVYDRFPEVLAVGEELTSVPEAAKVSNVFLNQELQELRKVLQDISDTLEKFGSQKTSLGIDDRFQDVMGHFISQASDEIQSLFRLNANTMEEFQNTVQFFGEDTKKITTTDLFGVFAEFVTKFEKSHRENIMYKRHPKKETVGSEAVTT